MSMRQCEICSSEFIPGAWNSRICSDARCRSLKNSYRYREWHLANKSSENAKARIRVGQYSSEQKQEIYHRSRIKHGLKTLTDFDCKICATSFVQRTHNNCYCSRECAKIALRLNSKHKERYHFNIQHKMTVTLRNRLYKMIKRKAVAESAIALVGISIPDLLAYLESKWQPGMSWSNWTTCGWHIDHIKPLSNFNLLDPEELKKACHYSNLQPLWWFDNLSKGASV